MDERYKKLAEIGKSQFEKLKRKPDGVLQQQIQKELLSQNGNETTEDQLILPQFNYSANHESATKKIKILEETNRVISSERSKHETLIETTKGKIQLQDQRIAELKERIATMESDNKHLKEIEDLNESKFQELSRKLNTEDLAKNTQILEDTIRKLNGELVDIREKIANETRIQKERIVSNKTRTEGTIFEKKNLEQDRNRLNAERNELKNCLSEFQKTFQRVEQEKLEQDILLEAEIKKNRILESKILPLEKRYQKLEVEVMNYSTSYSREMEEKSLVVKQLDMEYRNNFEEKAILVQKLDNVSKLSEEIVAELMKEIEEKDRSTKNQVKTLETLIEQKNHLMNQLSNEVKRNAVLTQKNVELKKILKNRTT